MRPFLRLDGDTQGSIEVVEITDANQEQLERQSSELRSRIAVLVSSSPSPIRRDVDRMLNGSGSHTLAEIEDARTSVTDFYRRRC